MRRRWKQGLLIAVAAAFFFAVYRGRPQATPTGVEASRVTDAWVDAVHERARAGYFLVVRGTHPGDQVVAAASAATLTHAALYDPERDEVIEAVGKGVLRTPLRELLAQAHRLQIVRPEGHDEAAGREAVRRARSRVGYEYDWLGTVGLQSDRRYYCTELAVWAWRGRERGAMPSGVIHPEHMERHGEVVFDSGPRVETGPVAELSRDLHGRFAAVMSDARGVDHAARVTPTLYRGGVPDAEGVEWLKSVGVRTLVNLRPSTDEQEGALVQAAGMRYVHLPVAVSGLPTSDQIRAFFEIVEDPASAPVYVHCRRGVDRTGAMVALYRVQAQGWSHADALAEMEWFGARGLFDDLRRFVGTYTVTSR